MPSLPLKERATQHHPLFRVLPAGETARVPTAPQPLVPIEPLASGEIYRFHFDMTRCIGCHCCEVACSEQNDLPPELTWRRVGEIEGGEYPFAQRFHLSMGCNHCLEPACLLGCPVEAYTQNPDNGIVLHNADACIGCQYCTWNCPYSVPQFDPQRGVVGKCDLCHNRLTEGHAPACVNACPEEAIRVEKVNAAAWRENYAGQANAPGLPSADLTISTTRITLPQKVAGSLERVETSRITPQHAHGSLIAMTVMVQIAVGMVSFGWKTPGQKLPMAAALAIAYIGLGCSLLHLGRPAFAWRALKMWRRSWLSREVLFFSLFVSAETVLLPLLWMNSPWTAALAAVAIISGWAGLFSSASIYLLPARPAWNTIHTILEFPLTALMLGPLALLVFGSGNDLWLELVGAASAAQLLNQIAKLLHLRNSSKFENRASAQLLLGKLRSAVLWRFALGLLGLALVCTGHTSTAFLALLTTEFLGRWLFFVSVVPTNMASMFIGVKEAA